MKNTIDIYSVMHYNSRCKDDSNRAKHDTPKGENTMLNKFLAISNICLLIMTAIIAAPALAEAAQAVATTPSESTSALKWFLYNLQTISAGAAITQLAADLELYELADILASM